MTQGSVRRLLEEDMNFKTPCLKCLLVGDMDAGKTELLISYTHDTFPSGDLPVFVVVPPVNLIVDGFPITLSLDDTSGQEHDFQSRRLSYATADVAIICYSVTSRQSFENVVKKWAVELRWECPKVPILLAATNIEQHDFAVQNLEDDYDDSVSNLELVTTSEGEELARSIEARHFIECSAVTQYNVFYLFFEAARLARMHAIGACSIDDTFGDSINCCFPFARNNVLHTWTKQQRWSPETT